MIFSLENIMIAYYHDISHCYISLIFSCQPCRSVCGGDVCLPASVQFVENGPNSRVHSTTYTTVNDLAAILSVMQDIPNTQGN